MIKNSQVAIDMEKAISRWKSVVEKLGVKDEEKIASLCEYAQLHANALASGMVNENVAYGNPSNTAGMGNVSFPTLSGIPGINGGAGSGDLGQTLLPASIKIAAATPGLDLLPLINVNSNRVDLLFWDYKYDDVANFDDDGDERASTFKFFSPSVASALTTAMTTFGITKLRGRISAPLYWNFVSGVITNVAPVGSKAGWLQFKGFARIDEKLIFRAYTQQNTASSGNWGFSQALNTFANDGSILGAINGTSTLGASVIDATAPHNGVAGNVTVTDASDISMVSLNEDIIDDFTTDRKKTPLRRGDWEASEAGKIGPDSFTKSVEIGVAHVSAGIRLSEIADYKRMYGVDIVQKTKEQLVVQLQQKISIEIVDKVKEMGLRNRATLPAAKGGLATALAAGGITDGKIFDMSVTATAGALGGEHNASIARKLWAKVMQGSMYILNDGRFQTADYIVTSATVVSLFKSISGYTINPFNVKIEGKQLQPAGEIDGIKLYVDPYQNADDLTIYLGAKGTNDTPGLKFFAYMLAESVEVTSEKTLSPKLYMYSRYAIHEFGFFPEKQYMAIKVEDNDGILF